MSNTTTTERVQRWEDWSKEFLANKPNNPMTEQQAKVFIQLVFWEQSGEPLPDEIKKTFQYSVMAKRVNFYKLDITEHAMLVLVMLAENPATVVMYCLALKYAQTRGLVGKITIEVLSTLWPVGFLTEEQLHTAWDKQKLSLEERKGGIADNFLDTLRVEEVESV